MSPNTATAQAVLGLSPRAPLTTSAAGSVVERQNTLSMEQVAADLIAQSAGGIDGPAAKGERPGTGLQHGWDQVVNAVVAEAGAPNVGGRS